jgi:hypothetical protein
MQEVIATATFALRALQEQVDSKELLSFARQQSIPLSDRSVQVVSTTLSHAEKVDGPWH